MIQGIAATLNSRKIRPSCMKHWINDNFGSRRGLARHWWFKFQYLMGQFKTYQQIDWQSVDRLVFVCMGNICRSAYAEAVSHSRGYESVSCGINTTEGAPANETAIRIAESRGFNLRDHKTTPIQNLPLRKNDLLVAMEPWQAMYLQRELGKTNACTLLGLWRPNPNPYVHDPFSSTNAYFKLCFSVIESSVDEITGKINKIG